MTTLTQVLQAVPRQEGQQLAGNVRGAQALAAQADRLAGLNADNMTLLQQYSNWRIASNFVSNMSQTGQFNGKKINKLRESQTDGDALMTGADPRLTERRLIITNHLDRQYAEAFDKGVAANSKLRYAFFTNLTWKTAKVLGGIGIAGAAIYFGSPYVVPTLQTAAGYLSAGLGKLGAATTTAGLHLAIIASSLGSFSKV